MQKQFFVIIALMLILISCVPKPEPYVLEDREHSSSNITQEIALLEEQAKEQVRAQFEAAEQKKQAQQQEAQKPAEEPKPQVTVQQGAQTASLPLGVYPNYFMDGDAFKSNFITVVGEEAPSSYVVAVSNLMARSPGTKPTGFSMLASEINDLSKYNIVVAGTACNNEVVEKLLGTPIPCDTAPLPSGKGLIRLYESANGNVVLLAAGKTDALVIAAVNAIGTDQFISVTGNEICVQGTTLVAC